MSTAIPMPTESRTTPGRRAIRMPVAACAVVALLLGLVLAGAPPAAAEAPGTDEVTVAAYQTLGGVALLHYASATNTFSVSWDLLAGEVNTEGEIPGDFSWAIASALYDDDGTLIGCITTADGTAASGQIKSSTGKLAFGGCLGSGYVNQWPVVNKIRWSFYAGFLSTSYDIDSSDQNGAFWGSLISLAAGVVVEVGLIIACPFTAVTCAVAAAVGPALIAAGGIVVSHVIDFGCNGDLCSYGTETTLLNGENFVGNVPILNLDHSCVPSGVDTWNIIEEMFYNRPPSSPGIGSTNPYDSGGHCLSIGADDAFLGLSGTLTDEIDMMLMATVDIGPASGDGPNAWVAEPSDVNKIEWTAVQTGNLGDLGTFRGTLTSDWDFEWAGEPDPREAEFTSYQHHPAQQMLLSGGGCYNCGGTGIGPMNVVGANVGITVYEEFLAAFYQLINAPPSLFCSENPIAAEGVAKGFANEATDTALANIGACFDVIPTMPIFCSCFGPSSAGASQFIVSSSATETKQALDSLANNSGQKVLVVHDLMGVDWEAYGEDTGKEPVPAESFDAASFAGSPLVTIIETL